MKKILFLLFIVPLFFGCSKKDNPTPSPFTSAVVGQWAPGPDLIIYYNGNAETGRNTLNYNVGTYYYVFKVGGVVQIFQYDSATKSFFQSPDGIVKFTWIVKDNSTFEMDINGTPADEFTFTGSNTFTLTTNFTSSPTELAANPFLTSYKIITTFTRQ